jgi:hypothetical protein
MTPFSMASVEKLLAHQPRGLQGAVARRHPRVNIQNDKGKAKPYQVRQVLEAIAKLQGKSK